MLFKKSVGGVVELVDRNNLEEILQDKPYDLAHFLRRVDKVARQWADKVFDRPFLASIYHHSQHEDGQEEEQERLLLLQQQQQEDRLSALASVAAASVASPAQSGVSAAAVAAAAAAAPSNAQRLRKANASLHGRFVDPLEDSVAIASSVEPRGGRSAVAARRSNQRTTTSNVVYASSPPLANRSTSVNNSSNNSSGNLSGKRKRSGGGRLLRKNQSATRLTFDDGDPIEESDDGDDDIASNIAKASSVTLSDLPTRPNKRMIQIHPNVKKSNQTPGLAAIPSQQKNYEGRRRFTDEEKRAIREGVRVFGKGHWAVIKDKYSIILNDRTSGQIKVCMSLSISFPSWMISPPSSISRSVCWSFLCERIF